MNAEKLVTSITAVTRQLTQLIGRENELLKVRRPSALEETASEKSRLTATYERQSHALKAQPNWKRSVPGTVVEELRSATRDFHAALAEHRRLVQAAKSVAERVFNAIRNEASQRDGRVTGYDRTATMRPMFNAAKRPVSLSLNQVV